MPPPLLISLPRGLHLSGINTWAARLATWLTHLHHPAALLVHPEPPDTPPVDFNLPHTLPLHRLPESPSPHPTDDHLPHYLRIVDDLFDRHRAPICLAPTLTADNFALAARLTTLRPDALRLLGWLHADIPYDLRVLAHYAPAITAFVASGTHIAQRLRDTLPHRASDILTLPYAIPAPTTPPQRTRSSSQPIRLIYTGRMEHDQKRILALPILSQLLDQHHIHHTLTLVGDGPAARDVDQLLASTPNARRLPTLPPHHLPPLYQQHDVFVLASRHEGQCISRHEAAAQGCAQLVADTASGSAELITNLHNGLAVPSAYHDDEHATAHALAQGLQQLLTLSPSQLAHNAWHTVRQHLDPDRYTHRVIDLLHHTALAHPTPWPNHRSPDYAHAALPADARSRMTATLHALANRNIIIHGVGHHTASMLDLISASPANIIAFADDNRATWGTHLINKPVLSPHDAAQLHITDVVISSHLHEHLIWARAHHYTARNLTVHRLYAA